MQSATLNTSVEVEREDIFDLYFQLMEDSSESPFIYHRWTLISVVGALLGRDAELKFGFDTIHPNMYVCLMGNAGTRKSSAISIGRKLADRAGYTTFARERTSKEKFIKDLADGFGKKDSNDQLENELDAEIIDLDGSKQFLSGKPSEVYISAGELEDFLGQGDVGFMSLLANMWDNMPHYDSGKMTSKDIFVEKPTVNMLGGCTPTTFNSVFPPEIIGQGMFSRLLLIYGGGARKKITVPKLPDEKLSKFFTEHLTAVYQNMRTEFTISEEALQVWDDVYQAKYSLDDRRFESYISRRHIHFYKLCIIIAALNLEAEITKEIAIQANSILYYTERLMPKALGEFGKSLVSDQSNVVLNVIENYYQEHGVGLSPDDVFIRTSTDFNSKKDLVEIVQKLKQAKKIAVVKNNGNPLLIPLQELLFDELPHVDLNLLREYRDENK